MRPWKDGAVIAEARPTFPDVRGPMRVWKDGAVGMEAIQHFLDVQVRLKTLFWEIERRKTSLWSSHTQPETGATFNIRHLSN
ncbi:hypothetical protein TNIN_70561 [Trichonephila inaurata madagascariensis]|uniref:Uncharacterized protein n=1 Tax=Trichonephila inaurata madagascariensis TaxID=2747483 RepID=A0A8X6Y946_9ARAC|nr:hypothetical protein TNIN_70561 [Trichonephila inaurata madagascariensis]